MNEQGGRSGLPPSLLDAAVDPDSVAAWAVLVDPGPAVITPLGALHPSRLSRSARVDALAALERQLAWLQARQYRLLAAMAADPGDAALDDEWVREDVAAALRLSAGTAAHRLGLARELTRLPATLALLERGVITAHHARALAEAVAPLDDATAAAVEARVLPRAEVQSLAQFRASVRRAVLAEDTRAAEARHAVALEQRRVAITPVADGMAELWALLPAEGAALLGTAIDALARRRSADHRSADHRSADHRRADALVELARRALGEPPGAMDLVSSGRADLPSEHGMRPAVQVTVALSTLLGLDDQPAELDGYGPIPATLARRIAADPTGTWRRLVTDEHGRLLDYGRTSYRPPRDVTEHVIARDRTCRFPHCRRRGRRCDLDHLQAWQDDGVTSATNLHLLCRRHHHVKHEAGWQPRRRPDGSTDWTSPTGQTYTSPAATYPLDRTLPRTPNSAADPDPPP